MCNGWRKFKEYLIYQYKLTGDKWYRKMERKIDKIIKNNLKNNEQDLDMDYEL